MSIPAACVTPAGRRPHNCLGCSLPLIAASTGPAASDATSSDDSSVRSVDFASGHKGSPHTHARLQTIMFGLGTVMCLLVTVRAIDLSRCRCRWGLWLPDACSAVPPPLSAAPHGHPP